MAKIVILRGNSGCGKSTTAKALHQKIGQGALLVSQDYVRIEMLQERDRPNNKAVDLLENLIQYGYHNCDITILEGILRVDVYESLFKRIEKTFTNNIFAYYFDVPFEETLGRHQGKNNVNFGETEMRRWWKDNDFLRNINEEIINKDASIDETVERIYNDIFEN